jgi:hypothetical protein
MLTVYGVVKSAAGTATRNWPALTKTVVRVEPFHCAIDPGRKFDPVRVSQVFPAGAVTLPGDATAIAALERCPGNNSRLGIFISTSRLRLVFADIE